MAIRALELVRGAWGATLVLAPRAVATRVYGLEGDDVVATRTLRVLGARHLTQAIASAVDPAPAVLTIGAWTDAQHAASMYGLAAVDRPRRRAALLDAAVASTFCLLERHAARWGGTPPQHGGLVAARDRAAAAIAPRLPLTRPFRPAGAAG